MTVNNEQLTKILTDFSQQNEQLLKLQHQLTIAQQKLSTGDWAEWESKEGLTTYLEQLITQIPTNLESKINELKSDNKVLETEQQRLTQLLTDFRQQKKELKEQVKTQSNQLQALEKTNIINTSYEKLLKDKDGEIEQLKEDLNLAEKYLQAYDNNHPNANIPSYKKYWKELAVIGGLGLFTYLIISE